MGGCPDAGPRTSAMGREERVYLGGGCEEHLRRGDRPVNVGNRLEENAGVQGKERRVTTSVKILENCFNIESIVSNFLITIYTPIEQI